jgi:hypothetical protein
VALKFKQGKVNHIQYNKWNNNIEKNMNANHFIIVEIFEKEVNHPLRGKVER